MKKTLFIFLINYLFFLCLSVTTFAQTANVNFLDEKQTIRGFGGIFVPDWYPGLLLDTNVLEKAYGNGPGQMGMSVLRTRISPNSAMWYKDVWHTKYLVDNYDVTTFSSIWSAPTYMKTNDSLKGGRLRTDKYNEYTDHLIDYKNYMASNGIILDAISVQNEPDYLGTFESCAWNSTEMRNYIVTQRSKFGSTKIIADESFNYNHSITDVILNDPVSEPMLDIVGTHLYWAVVPADYPLAISKGKEIWMTEHHTPLSNNTDSLSHAWPIAIDVGIEIHHCMTANISAYLSWSILRYYSMIKEDGSDLTKRGYYLSNYSRFVRPGYVRVGTTDSPATNVFVTAYKGNGKYVIVVVNNKNASDNVVINLQNCPESSFTAYVTNQTNNVTSQGNVSVSGNTLTYNLGPYSITTFVGTSIPVPTRIWYEAECEDYAGSLWNQPSNYDASEGHCVTVQSGHNSINNPPEGTEGIMRYDFNLAYGGTYSIWGRTIAPSPDDDSFWVRIDNRPWIRWNNILNSTAWEWNQVHDSDNGDTPVEFNLLPGDHSLTIAYREDGTQLDKIFITSDLWVPQFDGEPATNCSTSNFGPTAVASIDQNVFDFDNDNMEMVRLDGGLSYDSDGIIASYIWSEGGTIIAAGATPSVPMGLGSHQITLTVTDNDGASSSDIVIINVYNNENIEQDIWLEAECGTVGSLWNIPGTASGSNNLYATIKPGNNSVDNAPTNTAGHIVYNFTLDNTAIYKFWGRTRAASANDDSFWFRIDGGAWYRWNNISLSTFWMWNQMHDSDYGDQPVQRVLTAGNHTFTIAYREDGAQIDKILITSANTTPQNLGGDAYNCTSGYNTSPVANAGPDLSTTENNGYGYLIVSVDASGSYDPDGSIVEYKWSENGTIISRTDNPVELMLLSLGTHNLTLTVKDNEGAVSTDNVTITVESASDFSQQFWFEAECGHTGLLWDTPTDYSASDGSYLTIKPEYESIDSVSPDINGIATYIFRIGVDEIGDYTVWGRVIAPTPDDDSYWVRMDNGPWIRWNNIEPSTTWTWDQVHDSDNGDTPVTFNLTMPFYHYLYIGFRENGTKLDKLFVTNSGYVPSGTGSAAFNCALKSAEEEEIINVNDISVDFYPNPVNNVLTVELSDFPEKPAQLLIYNAVGSLLKIESIENLKNSIDVNDFTPGLYYMRIILENKTLTNKFIKE